MEKNTYVDTVVADLSEKIYGRLKRIRQDNTDDISYGLIKYSDLNTLSTAQKTTKLVPLTAKVHLTDELLLSTDTELLSDVEDSLIKSIVDKINDLVVNGYKEGDIEYFEALGESSETIEGQFNEGMITNYVDKNPTNARPNLILYPTTKIKDLMSEVGSTVKITDSNLMFVDGAMNVGGVPIMLTDSTVIDDVLLINTEHSYNVYLYTEEDNTIKIKKNPLSGYNEVTLTVYCTGINGDIEYTKRVNTEYVANGGGEKVETDVTFKFLDSEDQKEFREPITVKSYVGERLKLNEKEYLIEGQEVLNKDMINGSNKVKKNETRTLLCKRELVSFNVRAYNENRKRPVAELATVNVDSVQFTKTGKVGDSVVLEENDNFVPFIGFDNELYKNVTVEGDFSSIPNEYLIDLNGKTHYISYNFKDKIIASELKELGSTVNLILKKDGEDFIVPQEKYRFSSYDENGEHLKPNTMDLDDAYNIFLPDETYSRMREKLYSPIRLNLDNREYSKRFCIGIQENLDIPIRYKPQYVDKINAIVMYDLTRNSNDGLNTMDLTSRSNFQLGVTSIAKTYFEMTAYIPELMGNYYLIEPTIIDYNELMEYKYGVKEIEPFEVNGKWYKVKNFSVQNRNVPSEIKEKGIKLGYGISITVDKIESEDDSYVNAVSADGEIKSSSNKKVITLKHYELTPNNERILIEGIKDKKRRIEKGELFTVKPQQIEGYTPLEDEFLSRCSFDMNSTEQEVLYIKNEEVEDEVAE